MIWKRSISLLLVLCTLVGYIVLPEVPSANAETESVSTTSPNLVANGTFEAQSGDTVQANKDGWGGLTDIWSVVPEEGKENNYVAQVVDGSATAGKYIFYSFPVEAGCAYTFKIDYKGMYSAKSPVIYIRKDAVNGTNFHKKVLDAVADSWQTYETTVEVPADAAQVFILLASPSDGVGTACFDNVYFAKYVETDDDEEDEGGEGGEVVAPDNEIVIPEANLLRNPFFELTLYKYCTPLDAAVAPDGWTVEATGSNAKVFKSSVALYEGEWSVRLMDNSTTGSLKLSTKIENIQPGTEYIFGYYRYGEGAPKYYVRYYDADGKLLEEYYNGQSGYDYWRWSWKAALAPEGATYAIVSFETTAAQKCDMHVDSLRFYANDDETKTNLLTNASFEKYPEGMQDICVAIENEATTKGWKMSNTVTLVETETEMDKAVAGNYMLYLNDDSTKTGLNAYYTLDVEPGKTYAFSGMFRGEYTEGNANIRMSFYQDEDCQVPAMIGTTNYKAWTIGCSPEHWSRASGSATAPESATKLRVYIVSNAAANGWTYFSDLSVVEDVTTKFANLDFEDLDESGAMDKWFAYENGTLSANDKNVFAGKLSLQVKDNSEAVQQGAISKLTDLGGYQVEGYSSENMIHSLAARVKDSKTAKAQITMVYYDSSFEEVGRQSLTSAGTGKWQFLELYADVPASAAYAKILLTVGEDAAAKGTVYFDDITLSSEYCQYLDEAYDWEIKLDEGNRLYFTEEELAGIKEFAKDDTVNIFGVSGADAYRDIIKQANVYLNEKVFHIRFSDTTGTRKEYFNVNMEHIQDCSADPLLIDAPDVRNWPYLEGISDGLRDRFQTVAMAYALTGDTRYADKCISWAMDMCEWEYWCETKYSWAMGNVNSTLCVPRIVIGMATIYDMCYDRMTPEQRTLIVQNMIHKGLKPLYIETTGPNRLLFHNKGMMRCTALLIGALAIINEDNKAEVGKYLDRAYAYGKAFLDARYTSADNEGYSYTNVSVEDLLIGMDCSTRVTGREGLLNHPYFSEVLVDWVVDFLAPGQYDLPSFSDCHGSLAMFKSTMMILNKTKGNGKAGYYLLKTGLDQDPFKVLLYANYEPVITEPTENDYVVFMEQVGYGGLRTGWEDGELMFYIMGNKNESSHSNYDQLSFMISTDRQWVAVDPGYSNLWEGFAEQEGHNTLIVDGEGQSVKGTASLTPVVDSQLYGQFSGSAPGAYGEGVLTQFDRHAIMINHNDRPYYIVIDEVASDEERVFDFNLNTGGWSAVAVDGKPLGDEVVQGNKVSIYGNNGYFLVEFVSKSKLNIEAKMYEDGGPVLQADNGSQKSTQFMTILNKPYGVETDETYYFLRLLKTPELVAYKTSSMDSVITKSANAQGTPVYFFRGQSEGDWIELPFTVSETGTYDLVLKMAKSYNYGIYKIYIDGEYQLTYDGYNEKVFAYDINLGKQEVAAGEHILRLELVGMNPKSIGVLISVASIAFGTDRGLPENSIYTEEVYDTDKVLGAKIHHSDNNVDIVLHNRGTGKITAGGVTTNGEQTTIIGLMEDGYMEGFTLVAGTSLVFNGKTLMKSSSAATVSADFRGKAKYAVTTEKAQSISLYAPYEIVGATVDGESVKYSVDGNVAKISVPAGTHTVELKVIGAVEYLWGDESGSGKALYDENGEMIYKYWKDIDGTEYLYEDGQLKINAYYDVKTKLLVREELLDDDSWQITYYNILGDVNKIEIQHPNGNLTTVQYQTDGSISTLVTDKRGEYLEMTMEYQDGSKTVAQYLDDKTVTTKYGANGNVLAVTTMYNDGRRIEETYDENGKLLSKITRLKGGNREEVVYNADGSVVTSAYTAGKLTSVQTVNADGTSVLEEYLEDGSVRVTKYDKDGNVTEITIDGKLVEEEKADNSWIIIVVIVAVAVIGAAALVIVLVKIKKRNAK